MALLDLGALLAFVVKPYLTNKAMLISQGFNPEASSLTTFVEHCERAETTDSIASLNRSATCATDSPSHAT